jgi:hypothetical protein
VHDLPQDMGNVESHFGPFGDSVCVGVRFVPKYHKLRKSFWMHPMVHLGDKDQVDTRFGLFGDSANLDAR